MPLPMKRVIRFAKLPTTRPTGFDMTPGATELTQLAHELGLIDLCGLSFTGSLRPAGHADWRLTARLVATARQACVVTLAAVATRVDETITRHYVARYAPSEGSEVEMPDDDGIEPLPETLDLAEVMAEALILALPLYPRKKGAELTKSQFTAPGRQPMTDAQAKPFASLAVLRDRLEK
ncbi:MAG: DUF177 domain-containing protein [Pseudomonadota bacterium]